MIESKPLLKSTKTAFGLLQASFQRAANELAADGLTDMGLSLAEGWTANLDTGMAQREVPEPKAE